MIGDMAELILEGLMCQECGALMDDMEQPGHPRTCEFCVDGQED